MQAADKQASDEAKEKGLGQISETAPAAPATLKQATGADLARMAAFKAAEG